MSSFVVLTDSGTFAPAEVARVVEVDDPDNFAEGLSDGERNTFALLHGHPVQDNLGPATEMVEIRNAAGDLLIGRVEVLDEDQTEDSDEDNALRQAAVAWNFLMRTATFTVRGHTFSAADCNEWWA